MIRIRFRFDWDRISKRCRRKKTRERVFIASLSIFTGIILLCTMGHNSKIFHASGILTATGIHAAHGGLADKTKIMIDQRYYIISVYYSEKELRSLLPELKNIEGAKVDFQYLKYDQYSPIILELKCADKEIISFEPTYSNMVKDDLKIKITCYLFITGGLICILRDLRILRIYRKRSRQNEANQS